jgi:hypothetical protein
MAFAGYALMRTPLGDAVAVFVIRFAAPGFVVRPIEAERGKVEQVGELLAVFLLERRITRAAEHEEIAAEQKVMPQLFEVDGGVGDRFASGIAHVIFAVALAMLFDARPALSQVFVVRQLALERFSAPGFGCK